MSKGGGGGGSTTTVQKADPWVGLQQPLMSLYSGALNNFKTGGPQYYPGQTVAGTNGAIQGALAQGTNLASSGPSPLLSTATNGLTQTAGGISPWQNPAYGTLNAFSSGQMAGRNPAQGYFGATTGGAFLGANPYIDQQVQNAMNPVVRNFTNAVTPGIASQFSLAGRLGSGANQTAMGNAENELGLNLGTIASNMYGQNYSNERQLQQAAAGQLGQLGAQDQSNMLSGANAITGQTLANQGLTQQAQLAAPQMDQAKYNDLDKLLGIGQYEQGNEQNLINAAMQRWNYNQNLPTQNLQTLSQLLQGGMALNSTSQNGSSMLNRNPFASALGGGFMGGALGPMMGLTGPAGAIGGALLGGLFG